MTRKCSKRLAALVWALLECMFFSSVVLGWTWLSIVLQKDGYFPEYCNATVTNVTSLPVSTTVKPKSPCVSRRPRTPNVSRKLDVSTTTRASDLPFGEHGISDLRIDWDMLILSDTRILNRLKRAEPDANLTSLSANDVIDLTGHCREKLRVMFALVLIIRDLLTFPLGIFYDKYGTTRTRLLTVLTFALGTLMMTFTSSSVPWLVVPALALTGVAGSAVFLTNLQTANLFGRKRHIVISLYVGAAYSNGIITWLMQLFHTIGVDVQTSFMFLTIGIVPMLVSTVAFLPKTRIPWPLPADYGKRRNQSLDEAMLRKQRAWQRRMSEDLDPDLDPHMYPDSSPLTDYASTEAGVTRCRRPPPRFSPTAVQPLFVWSLLWFGIHKLHEAVFEMRVVEIAGLEIMGPLGELDYLLDYGGTG
ncbi:equilibrative nucleobase transporter 1-like [Physella acuta]|uniref:equilibrative nucleobase transporter 1-like n=1 Tax=Physella acuta TaxID=109671 RepID=UPI0027DC60DC|nr:equilibrative nucleobase transporter 1-like [Physella acuta]